LTPAHSCPHDSMALPCARGFMCGYFDTGKPRLRHQPWHPLTRLPATSTSAQRATTLHEHLIGFLYSLNIHDAPATTARRGRGVSPLVSSFGLSPICPSTMLLFFSSAPLRPQGEC
jgi:hypothetical protein